MESVNWLLLLPEAWLAASIIVIILADLFLARFSRWLTYLLCQVALLGGLFFVSQQINIGTQSLFLNSLVVDNIGCFLKVAILIISVFVLIYSRIFIAKHEIDRGEYFILMLFSILGSFILVSSLNFLTIYLGMELITLPLLALIPIARKDPKAPEAALKYFVMSAMASGMFLFGISLLYGATKSFDVLEIAMQSLEQLSSSEISLTMGMMFVLVGIGFKLGAVPFHMWVPDVYQGAPTSVTLFISTLSKLAGFGLAVRMMHQLFPIYSTDWQQIILVIAVLSLIVGNLAAIVQQNFKRLLGYSTIAHIGFMLLGFLAISESGFAAALFYMVSYTIMALAAFGILIVLSHKGFEADKIEDLKGLAEQQPWLALLMMFIMLSFTGIPPLVGFYAKFWILDALISSGWVKLAIFAVILTVISAFYYLKIIRVMYFDKPLRKDLSVNLTGSEWAVLSLNSLTVLFLGIFPASLFNVCAYVLK